jgi:hypothetical protein
MADACVGIESADPGVAFIAPAPDQVVNYVSFWHRQDAGWAPLPPGQASSTPQIAVLGQTLPLDLNPDRGSGYLH